MALYLCLTLFCLYPGLGPYATRRAQTSRQARPAIKLPWETPARLRRFPKSRRGRVTVSVEGIEFDPLTGRALHWPFVQIKTLDLARHRLVVVSYENKRWHQPGDRAYRFDLGRPMPPKIAARLALLLGKPVINQDPLAPSKAFAVIRARHRTLTGGTNGVLRFSHKGISYITTRGNGGRSWRWRDIQTLSRPNPFQFTLRGYRESFDFELKEPMSRKLFDRLWELVYGRGLRLGSSRPVGRRQ